MSFTVCDVFLNLVPALQVEVLVRWLDLCDVVKLDSALCSSRSHDVFLAILGEEYCVFDNSSSKLYNKLLPWVIQRKAKVSTVDLTQGFTNAHREMLGISGKNLRTLITSVHIFNPPNTVKKIFTMCPSLEKLVFSDYDLFKDDICSVLQHLPLLQHLNLSRCSNITGEMLANINAHGKNLMVVDLSLCQFSAHAVPVQVLAENHTIRTFTVAQCMHVSWILPFVLQCKALTSLYVNEITLNDVFTVLAQCPALTTLSAGVVDRHPSISTQQLNTLISLIQNLQALHLYHPRSMQWQEGQLRNLVHSTPKLRALFTGQLKEDARAFIATALGDVQRLMTEDRRRSDPGSSTHHLHTLLVDDISNEELQSILGICPQLVSLTILEFGLLDVVPLDLMTTIGQSTIRMLDIRECESFQSTDVLPLHNLINLSLDLCFELQHSDLVKLLNRNPKLRKLSLIGCAYLTQNSLLYIMKKCHCLEELAFDNINTGDNFHTYASGNVRGLNTTLVEGLIRLHHPNIELSIHLLPELL